MSAGEERKGTRVTFLDQTGAKSVEAVIADTVSAMTASTLLAPV